MCFEKLQHHLRGMQMALGSAVLSMSEVAWTMRDRLAVISEELLWKTLFISLKRSVAVLDGGLMAYYRLSRKTIPTKESLF